MKPRATSGRFPSSPQEIAAAINRAPSQVTDPDCPYDPNDAAAVDAFWRNAAVRRPGQRGPGKKPKKVLVSIRYSPEVVDYFKAEGEGWQARMDEALREWVAARRSA